MTHAELLRAVVRAVEHRFGKCDHVIGVDGRGAVACNKDRNHDGNHENGDWEWWYEAEPEASCPTPSTSS